MAKNDDSSIFFWGAERSPALAASSRASSRDGNIVAIVDFHSGLGRQCAKRAGRARCAGRDGDGKINEFLLGLRLGYMGDPGGNRGFCGRAHLDLLVCGAHLEAAINTNLLLGEKPNIGNFLRRESRRFHMNLISAGHEIQHLVVAVYVGLRSSPLASTDVCHSNREPVPKQQIFVASDAE